MRDPYEVLGIERGASYVDARRVYMRRIRLLHPDRVVGDVELASEATKLTAELTGAWDLVRRDLEAKPKGSSGEPGQSTSRPADSRAQGERARSNSGERESAGDPGSANHETADDILDWMVGALLEEVQRQHASLRGDELLMLRRPAVESVSRRRRALVRLYRPALLLLDSAIESDLAQAAEHVDAPSGISVPREWWDAYVRLDELGDESLLLFMLDDVLDPPTHHWLT